MDELDQQAKQFKFNAEQLEVVCDKLTHLSQDKRKARKAYQEEHAKIAARLNHVSVEANTLNTPQYFNTPNILKTHPNQKTNELPRGEALKKSRV